MIRTRFAPTPFRYIQLEDLRNALFSYLIAEHENGRFVLRMEDINQNLKNTHGENLIYKLLETFHLEYDEGPNKEGECPSYVQSERKEIYLSYAEKLVNKGEAYYCFCDEETLAKKRMQANEERKSYMYDGTCRDFPKDEAKRKIATGEKYVIRQKMPKEGTTSYHDLVYGDITVQNGALEDQILMKSNGMPTYNFANVIDDALMQISYVTRKNTYLSSMPKYLLLYDALNFPRPEFIHLPSIVNKEIQGQNKDDDLMDLLEQGFLPEAIINYLALLGWSPKSEKEFFSMKELIEEFNIKNIKKRPACFDMQKLKWFNAHYIKALSEEEFVKFAQPYLESFYNIEGRSQEWIQKLLLLYKNSITFGAEIPLVTHMFFTGEIEYDDDCIRFLKSDNKIEKTLMTFKQEIESMNLWTMEAVDMAIENTKVKCDVTGKNLYMPIRIAITGSMQGPELKSVIYLLGKETILKRMEK